MVHDLIAHLDAGDAEGSGRAIRQMAQDERVGLAMLLVPQHQVSEATLFGFLDHSLHQVVLPLVILYAREGCFDFFHKVKYFLLGRKKQRS